MGIMSSTRDISTGSNRASSSSLTILETLKIDDMLHVMEYLSVRDLVRSQRVSKAWSDLVLYTLSRKRSLTLSSVFRYDKTFTTINKFFTMTSLRHLLMKIGPGLHCLQLKKRLFQFDDIYDYNSGVPHLIAELCPNLQKLLVYAMDVDNWNVPSLHYKALKSVSFDSCRKVTDSLLSLFAPMLEEVRIIGSDITGSFLLNYQVSHLKKLELSDCKHLQPSLLCETVGGMKQLTSLTINSPSKAMIVRLHDVLLQLPQLQEFSCTDSYNKEGSLAPLAAMNDLRVLNLSDINLLSDQVFKNICLNCTQLRALYIERNRLNTSYAWLLPELEELRMDYIQLPPSSAAAESFKLRELHCFKLNVGDVQRLMTLCPKLSVLNIRRVMVHRTEEVCYFVQEVIKAVKLQPWRTNYLTLEMNEYGCRNQYLTKEVDEVLQDCLVKVFCAMWWA